MQERAAEWRGLSAEYLFNYTALHKYDTMAEEGKGVLGSRGLRRNTWGRVLARELDIKLTVGEFNVAIAALKLSEHKLQLSGIRTVNAGGRILAGSNGLRGIVTQRCMAVLPVCDDVRAEAVLLNLTRGLGSREAVGARGFKAARHGGVPVCRSREGRIA